MSELAATGGIDERTGLLGLTPSQTVGPYLAIGLDWGEAGRLAVPLGSPGAFWVRGQVLDGAGEPVRDALVEFWGPDAQGRFPGSGDPSGTGPSQLAGFRGLARSTTAEEGLRYRVHTVRPAPLPAGEDPHGPVQAPHLDVSVFARGMLDRVVTRMYFPGEPLNEQDPVLGTVPADRRHTLVAQDDGEGGYRFDIRVQGEGETVFFRV